jgi:hypothetical protein
MGLTGDTLHLGFGLVLVEFLAVCFDSCWMELLWHHIGA